MAEILDFDSLLGQRFPHCVQTSYKALSASLAVGKSKGKAIPLEAWTGPVGFRKLRLPHFKKIGTRRWQGCQLNTPASFTWYSFLSEAESTLGP
jgi:hypothetical protein